LDVTIDAIAAEHILGFHNTLDVVAHERKYLAMLEAPPLERTRQWVMNNIAKGHTQLVALSQDQVVGWCDVLPKERPIYAHGGVLGMGLLPEFRGKGLGERLLMAAMAEAWKALTRIVLTVHADNTTARALYEKVGFKHEGVMNDAVLIDGEYKNVLLMAIVNHASDRACPSQRV
jgi:RimJ/RimL family protein N-acetyltransferase